jgi:excisionase family DNA binding protein
MSVINYDTLEGIAGLGRLLTPDDVSRLLNIKKSCVYYLVRESKIPHIKIERLIRFQETEIIAWLRSKGAK